ncbi:MAG: MBL fold metallo-hydrolase [Deltaproteobacteria bacterium]|nr:MBL fold metallo-hydrolase [Deltaproteobacteria bacterium]
MQFSVLGSGSSGNACYVGTGQTGILIDAGLSARELISRLRNIGVNPKRIDAIIITHEHSDHIKGAGPLARRLDIPVYLNHMTLRKGIKILGNISQPMTIHTGQTVTIRDLCVETFTKCHDAADPLGLVISSNGVKLGILTDTGRSTRLVEERLKGCRALIMEFNHDPKMLHEGPYPLELRRRIKGPEGHLSNQQAGDILKTISHENLECLVLAHLSEENNAPVMALRIAREALLECGCAKTRILLGRQDEPIPLETLT